MRLDRSISLRVVAPLQRCRLWRARPGIPILMYHSVSEDPETGTPPYFRLAIPPALFRRHLGVLKEEGYEVTSLSAAANRLRQPDTGTARLAVITFDDGFQDFLLGAWPALRDFGFGATVFLPTAFIGDERRMFKNRACLTWREVEELHQSGIQFGSHTVHHPRLADLSEADLDRELGDSRRVLEERLCATVDDFAHPYAFPLADRDYAKRYDRAMRQAGYRQAVTTLIGRADAASDSLRLPRLPVNGADDPEFLRAKLRGAYDWLQVIQSAAKRLKRAVRTKSPTPTPRPATTG
jgi:peptidoglycan/xylan/chitin deacetylase (PgdA/CDA1 family)